MKSSSSGSLDFGEMCAVMQLAMAIYRIKDGKVRTKSVQRHLSCSVVLRHLLNGEFRDNGFSWVQVYQLPQNLPVDLSCTRHPLMHRSWELLISYCNRQWLRAAFIYECLFLRGSWGRILRSFQLNPNLRPRSQQVALSQVPRIYFPGCVRA